VVRHHPRAITFTVKFDQNLERLLCDYQGMINEYVLLVSPLSLLSTYSLNVLILLLSVAGILALL